MKSDITQDTFSARKHFSRVISQQGRVTIDADSNEQTSILLHYLRTLALDLIGPYAAPVMGGGFRLSKDSNERLMISVGRYYVNGMLVENDRSYLYTEQPHNPLTTDDAFAKAIADKKDAKYWVYLDAWERHITALEDDSIREKALGGPDTCTRAKVVWQVRALDLNAQTQQASRNKRREWLEGKKKKLQDRLAQTKVPLESDRIKQQLAKIERQLQLLNKEINSCDAPLDQLLPRSDASLGARVDPGARIVDACVTSPDSKYRGAENQLYRVEVHQGGVAGEATFKWSRDNGSVATAWLGTSGYDLEVANARGFSAGNWVELIDDGAELQSTPGLLVKLAKVEGGTLSVDPDAGGTADALLWNETSINPKVRRWDHFATEDIVLEDDGSILIVETPVGTGDAAAKWIDLEDGIQVQFAEGGEYRTGDFWLIPARVATGDIEWPEPASDALGTLTTQVAPRGVVHYFAPLGFVSWGGEKLEIRSCYCEFEPLSSCFNRGSIAFGTHLLRPTNEEIMLPEQPPDTARPARPPRRGTTERAASKKGTGRASKKAK
jgi:hypothetical protein